MKDYFLISILIIAHIILYIGVWWIGTPVKKS